MDIHIPGLDVGGGWNTGCRTHLGLQNSACSAGGRTDKSVWSVVPTCDRKMKVKIKGKMYRTMVRPVSRRDGPGVVPCQE